MSRDLGARLEFLEASCTRLREQLERANAELNVEIRRLERTVRTARDLIGEPTESEQGPQAEHEATKQTVREAILRSAQGTRARELLGRVQKLEQRLRQVEQQLQVLRKAR